MRSTHGVNCTGSCSWKVYVKDGIITWETQQTDYPSVGPDSPEYEPRGCPRGAAFSWYTYSPTRVRYPYVRGVLLEMYREAEAATRRPGPGVGRRSSATRSARRATRRPRQGRPRAGDLGRGRWRSSPPPTCTPSRSYGPDRVAGFSPIPAMSMASHAAGARFIALLGGSMLSFYDWYADLPIASPQVFGDQTDVPESGRLVERRLPDHVGLQRPGHPHPRRALHDRGPLPRPEGRRRVSPDYADNTKFADEWLPPHPGTDGALAMAMGHVILKEFFVDRAGARLRRLREALHRPAVPRDPARARRRVGAADRFLTAADLGRRAREDADVEDRPARRGDRRSRSCPTARSASATPTPARASWNLDLGDIDPALSLLRPRRASASRSTCRASTSARREGGGTIRRGVPARAVGGQPGHHRLRPAARPVRRRPPRAARRRGPPATTTREPYTPAWQEAITSVPAATVERIAREFAATPSDPAAAR